MGIACLASAALSYIRSKMQFCDISPLVFNDIYQLKKRLLMTCKRLKMRNDNQ